MNETEFYRHVVGEIVKEERVKQGMTLTELSERSGLATGYLSEVEHGKKNMQPTSMAQVSAALGHDMSWLLGETSVRLRDENPDD